MPFLIPMRHSYASIAVIAFAIGFVTGCGPRRHEVIGRVAFEDGTAYDGEGVVVAEAVVDGKPIMAKALIEKDGRFTLAGRNEHEGVLGGQYQVRLAPPRRDGGVDDKKSESKMPFDRKFLKFETSGLTFTVGSGSNELLINLGPKP